MQEHLEWRQGAHHARLDPPDFVWLKFKGPISREDAIWTVNLLGELGGQKALFIAADFSENTTIDPEGRRHASEHMLPEWFKGIVYVRTRIIHRAAAKGLQLVQRMLGRGTVPLYFVSTDEEARDTIARLRSQEPPPAR
jgi:hypothetical protein